MRAKGFHHSSAPRRFASPANASGFAIAVPGIAKARNDIGVFVQLLIDAARNTGTSGCRVWKNLAPVAQPTSAISRRRLAPPAFNCVAASAALLPVASIGIDKKDIGAVEIERRFKIVAHWFECFLVTKNSDVAQPRLRQNIQHRLGHAQTRTQDRNDR